MNRGATQLHLIELSPQLNKRSVRWQIRSDRNDEGLGEQPSNDKRGDGGKGYVRRGDDKGLLVILGIKITTGFAFFLAGGAKLLRAKPLAEQFEEFGLPSWSLLVVGSLEVAGAVGLFLDPLSFFAAVALALLMFGAVANHLKARHPFSRTAPALVLLALTICLAMLLQTA